MKKVLLFLLGIFLLNSCNKAERHLIDYEFKHKERMLDLEYIEKAVDVKDVYQLRVDIHELDSIIKLSKQ